MDTGGLLNVNQPLVIDNGSGVLKAGSLLLICAPAEGGDTDWDFPPRARRAQCSGTARARPAALRPGSSQRD